MFTIGVCSSSPYDLMTLSFLIYSALLSIYLALLQVKIKGLCLPIYLTYVWPVVVLLEESGIGDD